MGRLEMAGYGEYPVAVDYLVALQEFAAERGIPPQVVLNETGLPLNVLIQTGARIGHMSMDQAVRNVVKILDDPLLAIEYGKRLTISKHGVLGFAAQSSSTLMDAAHLIEQYMKTRSGSGDEFELLIREDYVCFRLYPLERMDDSRVSQFHILATLFSIETIARWLSGTQTKQVDTKILLSFDVTYTVPVSMLSPGLQLTFNAAANELWFPIGLMHTNLPHASPALVTAAQEKCEAEMDMLSSINSIAAAVRHQIRQQTGRLPTIEQIADQLNLSSRTLKRRLSEAGTSYQHLKDSERFRKAIALLETGRDSLEVIADTLGYSDASNFSKAFKNWSGVMPGEYREKHLKNAAE